MDPNRRDINHISNILRDMINVPQLVANHDWLHFRLGTQTIYVLNKLLGEWVGSIKV